MSEGAIVARCSVQGLQDGDIRKCAGAGERVIAIYRQEGKFFATQDRCSHALASLSEGWLEGFEVFCPVHEARFDIRTGKALCFPATEPIEAYDLTVDEAGEVVVHERKKP